MGPLPQETQTNLATVLKWRSVDNINFYEIHQRLLIVQRRYCSVLFEDIGSHMRASQNFRILQSQSSGMAFYIITVDSAIHKAIRDLQPQDICAFIVGSPHKFR